MNTDSLHTNLNKCVKLGNWEDRSSVIIDIFELCAITRTCCYAQSRGEFFFI
jgi:hypothetical protein